MYRMVFIKLDDTEKTTLRARQSEMRELLKMIRHMADKFGGRCPEEWHQWVKDGEDICEKKFSKDEKSWGWVC